MRQSGRRGHGYAETILLAGRVPQSKDPAGAGTAPLQEGDFNKSEIASPG